MEVAEVLIEGNVDVNCGPGYGSVAPIVAFGLEPGYAEILVLVPVGLAVGETIGGSVGLVVEVGEVIVGV